MNDETYIRVFGRVKEVREASVLFAVGESVERGAWIPRSLIHGADDLRLDALKQQSGSAHQKNTGERMVLRIFAWKARELGFDTAREPGGADEDLFGE